MCSSSTASTTSPCAEVASTSRIAAAPSSSRVAWRSERSSRLAIWLRMTRNRPVPSSSRMRPKVAPYQAVSPSRSRASGRASLGAKAVPHPAHGVDQRRLEAVIHLASQPPHQDLEHVGERVMVVVPHVRRDRGPSHDGAGVRDQHLEQCELLRRQLDRGVAAPYAARGQVYLEVGPAPDL